MTRLAPTHYRKTLAGFEPVSAAAREFHAKTKLGQIIELKGRRPRNPRHHAKFFALLSILVENAENFANVDHALLAVKAATDHGTWDKPHPRASKEIFYADSIAFDAMSQDEFEPFYDKALDAVIKYWLPVEKTALREAVEAFAA